MELSVVFQEYYYECKQHKKNIEICSNKIRKELSSNNSLVF